MPTSAKTKRHRRAPKVSSEAVKAAADRAEKRAKGEGPEIAKVPIDPPIVKAADVDLAITAKIEELVGKKMGRPPKYKPEFARIAAALCRRGATDYELAEEFEVSTVTIWRWQIQHEEFCKALEVGKGAYDERVKRSLAQRAIGYSYHTEKVFQFQGSIVRAKVVEHIPADVSAAKHWLANRRPEEFREVQHHEHGKPGDFDQMSDAELEQHIKAESAALVGGKPAPQKARSTRH